MHLTKNMKEGEYFAASLGLSNIAAGLERIMHGQQIQKEEKESFGWGAGLLGEMDWHSKHYRKKEHPELCVIATELRSNFYKALQNLEIPFNRRFFEDVYQTLKSCGKKVMLNAGELKYAHRIFKSMADDTLTKLQYAFGRGQI